MDNCLFCKIAAKEIPCHKVYEDNDVLAFLDIHPCAKGHTVVIPKQHFFSVLEINEPDWQKLMAGFKVAVKKIQDVLKPDGMSLGLNERPAGGQAVPHSHWHIIPRWEGDGGGSVHSIVRTKESIDVAELAKLFV